MVGQVSRAVGTFERMRGLLGRAPLGPDEGMLIESCNAVHTFGMRYPLDLVFLDHQQRVCKLVAGLAPYRMAVCWRAALTLELAAGALARGSWRVGDQLVWEERPCGA
jgi:uncharacterized membrane protein (UPF0127 family)